MLDGELSSPFVDGGDDDGEKLTREGKAKVAGRTPIIVLTGLALLCDYCTLTSIIPIIPLVLTEMDDNTYIFVLFASKSMVQIVANLVAGIIVDGGNPPLVFALSLTVLMFLKGGPFGFSTESIGLTFGVQALCYLLFTPVFGILSDKHMKTSLVAFGICAVGVGMGIMFTWNELWSVIVGLGLVGMGIAAADTPSMPLLTMLGPPDR